MKNLLHLLTVLMFIGCVKESPKPTKTAIEKELSLERVNEVPKTITKIVYKKTRIPSVLIKEIPTPAPPQKAAFMSGTDRENVSKLMFYTNDLLLTIKKYKKNRENLVAWNK